MTCGKWVRFRARDNSVSLPLQKGICFLPHPLPADPSTIPYGLFSCCQEIYRLATFCFVDFVQNLGVLFPPTALWFAMKEQQSFHSLLQCLLARVFQYLSLFVANGGYENSHMFSIFCFPSSSPPNTGSFRFILTIESYRISCGYIVSRALN